MSSYSNLVPKDVHWIVTTLPPAVRNVLKSFPGQVFLAGGAIRSRVTNDPVSDYDLFVGSRDAARYVADVVADGHRVYETENAYTVLGYRVPVQVIHRWTFNSPEHAILSFDFTIASAAVWWDGDKWCSVCHRDFYADLAAKRLVYLSPDREEEAGGSLLRVLKFYQRGFRIPLDSLASVVVRLLRGVDDEGDPGIWHNECKLARVLSELLREVDPMIDPDHIAHLPDGGDIDMGGTDHV